MTDAEGQRTAVERGTLKTIKPWDRSTVGLEGTSAPISPTPQPHTRAPQVQVGVELEANTRLQDTTFAFGYQLNLPQANVVFRGERGAAPPPLRPPSRSHLPPPPVCPPRAPGQ